MQIGKKKIHIGECSKKYSRGYSKIRSLELNLPRGRGSRFTTTPMACCAGQGDISVALTPLTRHLLSLALPMIAELWLHVFY